MCNRIGVESDYIYIYIYEMKYGLCILALPTCTLKMEAALYWITCWSVYETAQCYKSVHKLNNHCSGDLTAWCYLLFGRAWPLWIWEYWDVCILFCIRMSREIWNWDSSICKLYFLLLSLVIINKYAGDWNLLHWR